MIEVELRAKVANLGALEQKVKSLGGKYAYSMTNVDEYYLSAADAATCVFGNKEKCAMPENGVVRIRTLSRDTPRGLKPAASREHSISGTLGGSLSEKPWCALQSPESEGFRAPTERGGQKEKTVLLTIKTIANGDFSVRKELQIDVSDARETQRILEYFGCKKILTLTKHRKIYNVGVVGVLLDDVKELGSWVEVSIEGAKVDAEGARGKLVELLGKMGFGKSEIETKGYFNLAVEKLE